MAVVAFREVLPRTLQHRFGESPTAECKYVVTVDGPTASQDIIGAVGILHGAAHPEFSYLLMLDASLSETDRHHVEVTYRYEVPAQEFQPNPLLREDVWSFSSSGAAVPVFFYYDESDEALALTNSAGEVIPGAMTEEAELRATISGNRASFPMDIAAYVTNTLNNEPYLGCPRYSWKCNGIGAQQAVEVVNGVEVRYYQITVELAYRATGWPLVLIDEGYNYLDGDKLKRCWIEHTDDDGQVIKSPSANPVALSEDGRMLPPGALPRMLVRRVHRAVDFSTYFGNPSF
jgi:hypothetical protein